MAFLAVFLHDIFVSIDIEFIRFNGWIKETGQYGKSVNLIKICWYGIYKDFKLLPFYCDKNEYSFNPYTPVVY